MHRYEVLYRMPFDGEYCTRQPTVYIERDQTVLQSDILNVDGVPVFVDAIGKTTAGWIICVTPTTWGADDA